MISQRLPDVSLRHFQQDPRGPLRSQPADSEDRHHGLSGQMLSVEKMNTPQKQASFPLQQVLPQMSSHALLQFLHQRIFPEIAIAKSGKSCSVCHCCSNSYNLLVLLSDICTALWKKYLYKNPCLPILRYVSPVVTSKGPVPWNFDGLRLCRKITFSLLRHNMYKNCMIYPFCFIQCLC